MVASQPFALTIPCARGGPTKRTTNTFGDPWSLKGAPNPRYPGHPDTELPSLRPNATGSGISGAEVEFLAATNAPLLFDECATVEHDLSPVTARTSALAASLRTRGVRYVGYGLVSVLGPAHLAFPDSTEIGEQAFVHRVGAVAAPTTRLRPGQRTSRTRSS